MPLTTSPLRVAVEATPLLGVQTGVGRFCRGALGALDLRSELSVSAFAVTWRRRRHLAQSVPPGVATAQRAMPARPLYQVWAHAPWPPVEWFIGRCDVVHGMNFVVPPTRRAARVVTVHDLTVVRFPEMCDGPTLAFPAMVARAVRGGAWVHTHAQSVADEVVDIFGADPGRVRAVAPGVPPSPSPSPVPAGRLVDLPVGTERYVVAVGTVEPRKDYPNLVRAFGRVAAAFPEVALVIVGADGWGAEALHRELAASSWRSRVVRSGYLADAALARVMADADVMVYPSRYEGFGFPPLEAMALGVPVVATAAGAVPEVVGEAAVVVPPADEAALADALERVLAGVGRAELVAAGYRRAEHFTWSAFAGGMVDLYRAAVADR